MLQSCARYHVGEVAPSKRAATPGLDYHWHWLRPVASPSSRSLRLVSMRPNADSWIVRQKQTTPGRADGPCVHRVLTGSVALATRGV